MTTAGLWAPYRDERGAVCTGPQGLPALTLGWEVLEWTIDYLLQPDGPNAGQPWSYTGEQVRILLWWYAVDPLGRFVYRRAILRRSKGWGKDPFAASLACVEFIGPCRFDFFDDDGQPVAKPHPAAWVQLAAVNQQQTKNTMGLIPGMLSPQAIADYGLDIGKEVIYSAAGGQIQAVTSSPRALEGGRPSLVLPNETQHWHAGNGGHAMADVIKRNAGKSRDGSARVFAITNAHDPGLDSVGERDYDAWRKMLEGRSRGRGLMYDSREAPPETDLADLDSLRRGLEAAYGDSTWIDIDRLIEEILDPGTAPSEARRFYLNQIWASEDAWTTGPDWDSCEVPDRLAPGDRVVLSFDGSRSDDASSLCVVRVSDGLTDCLGLWERPEGPQGEGWEVPRDQVDGTVELAFATYDVAAFYCDIREFESYVDLWSDRYGPDLDVKASKRSAVGWDMRTKVEEFTRRGAENTLAAIADRTLKHTGHPGLRRHALNACRRPNRYGLSLGKSFRQSPRKVDALVAAIIGRIARADVLAAGNGDSDHSGEVWAL